MLLRLRLELLQYYKSFTKLTSWPIEGSIPSGTMLSHPGHQGIARGRHTCYNPTIMRSSPITTPTSRETPTLPSKNV